MSQLIEKEKKDGKEEGSREIYVICFVFLLTFLIYPYAHKIDIMDFYLGKSIFSPNFITWINLLLEFRLQREEKKG